MLMSRLADALIQSGSAATIFCASVTSWTAGPGETSLVPCSLGRCGAEGERAGHRPTPYRFRRWRAGLPVKSMIPT